MNLAINVDDLNRFGVDELDFQCASAPMTRLSLSLTRRDVRHRDLAANLATTQADLAGLTDAALAQRREEAARGVADALNALLSNELATWTAMRLETIRRRSSGPGPAPDQLPPASVHQPTTTVTKLSPADAIGRILSHK